MQDEVNCEKQGKTVCFSVIGLFIGNFTVACKFCMITIYNWLSGSPTEQNTVCEESVYKNYKAQ